MSKAVYINPEKFLAAALATGVLTFDTVRDIARKHAVGQNPESVKSVVGFYYNDDNTSGSIFVATDRETQQISRAKDKQEFVRYNLRGRTNKTQDAQTPGQVLPQGQAGVPALNLQDPAVVAQLLALATGAAGVQAQPAQAQAPMGTYHAGPDVDIPF